MPAFEIVNDRVFKSNPKLKTVSEYMGTAIGFKEKLVFPVVVSTTFTFFFGLVTYANFEA